MVQDKRGVRILFSLNDSVLIKFPLYTPPPESKRTKIFGTSFTKVLGRMRPVCLLTEKVLFGDVFSHHWKCQHEIVERMVGKILDDLGSSCSVF